VKKLKAPTSGPTQQNANSGRRGNYRKKKGKVTRPRSASPLYHSKLRKMLAFRSGEGKGKPGGFGHTHEKGRRKNERKRRTREKSPRVTDTSGRRGRRTPIGAPDAKLRKQLQRGKKKKKKKRETEIIQRLPGTLYESGKDTNEKKENE